MQAENRLVDKVGKGERGQTEKVALKHVDHHMQNTWLWEVAVQGVTGAL